VVVLSARPAQVRDVVAVEVPRPRTVQKVIEHPGFVELRERCWRLLRTTERAA
jgi:ABC-type nitrate/sulfonate/bicarbonate transport system ATPase subunit